MPENKYQRHVRRDWFDQEPERLSVSVESAADTGKRFTVFTTSSTWLDKEQVSQLINYLQYCQIVMDEVDNPVHID